MSSLRDQCPICKAFVEEFEAVFGAEQLKVTFLSEGKIVAGKPGERGLVPVIYAPQDKSKRE